MFVFPLLEGGNAVRFFHFVFFVSGSVSFVVFCRSSLLRGAFWKNFRVRTFVFGCWCWFCVFWWVFAYVFAIFLAGRSRKCLEKFSCCQVCCFFWVRSFFLSFFSSTSFFFSRDIAQVVTGHPHSRTCFACSFSLFVSRRLCLFRPFWPCVLLLGVFFSGCHSGPRAVLGFSWNLWGLSFARPFRGPFLGTRGGKGFSFFLILFFFFPFLFCGHTLSRKARPVISRRPAAGDRARPLARVRARGLPYLGRRVGPLLLWAFVGLFCEPVGHRDPRTHCVQGLFVREGGDFSAPAQALFHTHFLLPPQVFFFFFCFCLVRPSRPGNTREIYGMRGRGKASTCQAEFQELL